MESHIGRVSIYLRALDKRLKRPVLAVLSNGRRYCLRKTMKIEAKPYLENSSPTKSEGNSPAAATVLYFLCEMLEL